MTDERGVRREVVASDVEGTLSTGAQHRGIARYLARRGKVLAYRLLYLRYVPRACAARFGLADVQDFRDRWVRDLAALFRGWAATDFAALGEWVVQHELWPGRRERVLAELEGHRRAGRRVVLLSAMYQPILDALARRIGAEAYGTALQLRDGRATGRIVGQPNSAAAKTRRLREIVGNDALAAAYGDTEADVSMLELAAEPVAVSPDRGLRRVALARGWRVVGA